MSNRLGIATATTLAVTALLGMAHPAAGEPVDWRASFDDAAPSWEAADHDAAYRVDQQARTAEGARAGQCERLQVTASAGGSHILFTHHVGRARVLPELQPTIWIRSDRPGVQMLARVVLPRVTDPGTGRPLTALIQGDGYTQVGRWQELTIPNAQLSLARQVRVLRSKVGPHVDAREAYIDQIVLNVYSGKGASSVWIDDLVLRGHVPVSLTQIDRLLEPGRAVGMASFDEGESTLPVQNAPGRQVELHGSILTADSHALFPRAIEYRGEPLSRLKSLGFNTAYLNVPAAMPQLEDADRLGLWLVCPPPDVRQGQTIGSQYGPVLCWDLGWGLSRQELEAARHLTTDLRRADRLGSRPVICSPHSDLRTYSRHADILLFDRSPLGTSIELSAYRNWLERQPLLARPGTPMWATIQTEPTESIVRQMAALSNGQRPILGVQLEQIRLMAYTAVAAGARGLVFTSRRRLDTPEPVEEMRAEMLELVNLELSLIEPWVAAGERLGSASANDPNIRVSVLGTERARLLIAMRQGTAAQYVAVPGAGQEVAFVVPGVPESHTAYSLSAAGFRPLRQKRVTGGMLVTVPEFSLSGLIVLTQDPLVVNDLARRTAATASRVARLSHSLARRRLTLVENISRSQQQARLATVTAEEGLSKTRATLEHCEQLLSRGDTEGAYRSAEQALFALSQIQRADWSNAPRGLASPVTNPFRAHYAALPLSWTLADRVQSSSAGPNRLPGGDFENLDTLIGAGWKHFRHHDQTLATAVELSPQDRHAGQSALRLSALATNPEEAPQVIESPPVWIQSAPVFVAAGQIVEIHGWTKVARRIEGSQDGLLIIDSLTGRPLAARILSAGDWSEFVMYRAADEDQPLVLTFALTGLGEAWIDDVTVSPLLSPAQQARPPYRYGPTR